MVRRPDMSEQLKDPGQYPILMLAELEGLLGVSKDMQAMPNSIGADGWVLEVDDERLAAIMPRSEDTYRERFTTTRGSYLSRVLVCPYLETENHTVNILPSTVALNRLFWRVHGPYHYSFVEVDEGFIPAPTFIHYLRAPLPRLPQATRDLNYIIHDRALDDHIPGELVTPQPVVEFTARAAARLDAALLSGPTEELLSAAGTFIAARDFMSYSLTLYTWDYFNDGRVLPHHQSRQVRLIALVLKM